MSSYYLIDTLPKMDKEVMQYALTCRLATHNQPGFLCISMNMKTKDWTVFVSNEFSANFNNTK